MGTWEKRAHLEMNTWANGPEGNAHQWKWALSVNEYQANSRAPRKILYLGKMGSGERASVKLGTWGKRVLRQMNTGAKRHLWGKLLAPRKMGALGKLAL